MDLVRFTCIRTSIIVVGLGIAVLVEAQNNFPYQWNANRSAAIVAPAVALNMAGAILSNTITPFTTAQLHDLQARQIRPVFDQRATEFFSKAAGHKSDYLLWASSAMPFAMALAPSVCGKRGTIAAMGFESMLLCNGLTHIIKNTVQRPRPLVYNVTVPETLKLERDAQRAFFSGHTSVSATACFFTATVFSDLYPKSRWKPFVWSGAVAIPALTGYFRYRAGKHFPTDIAAGYAIGALCGVLVPRWYHIRR